MPNVKHVTKALSVLLSLIFFLVFFSPSAFAAADPAPFQQAQVSFTFDDGFVSAYQYAVPILASRGIPGTMFVVTGTTSGTANDGLTDDNQPAMTWAQVKTLQNTYGWEIGSHTVTHPELPTISLTNIKAEVNNSLAAFKTNGIDATSFATPYGAYDNKTLIEIMKTYNLHRGFWDRDDLNSFPYQRSVMMVQSVEKGVTVNQVKAWVNQAIVQKKWLVLVFHSVRPTLDSYQYEITTSDFTQIADYVKTTGIKAVTPNTTLNKPGPTLLTNPSFTSGMTGWTTDNTNRVKVDSNTNGSYPSPTQSVLFTAGTTAVHLYSGFVAANSGTTYQLESFVNTNKLSGGELGFYIDEYNSSNALVSSQLLGTVPAKQVTIFSALYKPTSSAVTKIKVQAYTSPTTGTAYVDNINLYNLAVGTPSPTPTPSGTPTPTPSVSPSPTPTPTLTPTPVPTSTNLVANSSFEQVSSGWPVSWTKDGSGFSLDTLSNGDNGINSIRLATNTTDGHVFSALIPVVSTNNYVWKQYIKAQFTSGEFGYYIDEYDTNGNWISGQWKGQLSASYTGVQTINYKPTSSSVKKIGLQYYAVGNSKISLYIDSVYFGS